MNPPLPRAGPGPARVCAADADTPVITMSARSAIERRGRCACPVQRSRSCIPDQGPDRVRRAGAVSTALPGIIPVGGSTPRSCVVLEVRLAVSLATNH